jgi:hypothetical protein
MLKSAFLDSARSAETTSWRTTRLHPPTHPPANRDLAVKVDGDSADRSSDGSALPARDGFMRIFNDIMKQI